MRNGPAMFHRLRHPELHQPEILTGREVAARDLSSELLRCAAEIAHELAALNDDADPTYFASRAVEAAVALVELYADDPDAVDPAKIVFNEVWEPHMRPDTPPTYWPCHLSAVLAVTTRKMVARGGPSEVNFLLTWMLGYDNNIVDHERLRTLAVDVCAPSLLAQFPTLADPNLPAVPATWDTDTVDVYRPGHLAEWVSKIAHRNPDWEGHDPLLPVCQLSTTERRHFRTLIGKE